MTIIIGVDARTYFFRSGLGRYCRNVLSAMTAQSNGTRFVIWLSNEKTIDDFPSNAGGQAEVRVSQAPFGQWEAEISTFRDEISRTPLDVFFSPYSPVPPGLPVPSVLTVHDLTVFNSPELHLEGTVQYLKSALPQSLRTASSIVAVSQYTASDIERFFPGTKSRTVTIPLGVEHRFMSRYGSNKGSTVLECYGLKKRSYILYVGNLEARKNLLRAVQAYESSSLFGRVPFVLAGAQRWGIQDLIVHLRERGLYPWVRMLNYVADEDLPDLYGGALFFVYPSLCEGFGLPVLEAMASGVAVLASNCSSLPEVTGDAAVLADPMSVEAIRAGMDRLAADASLRERLAAMGRARARECTWQLTGEKLLRLLRTHGEKS